MIITLPHARTSSIVNSYLYNTACIQQMETPLEKVITLAMLGMKFTNQMDFLVSEPRTLYSELSRRFQIDTREGANWSMSSQRKQINFQPWHLG